MKKKALIIEDIEVERLALHGFLEDLGFEVHSARNADEARRLAECLWRELDVMIIDMELDKNDDSIPTGAEVTIDIKQRINSFPPEMLIYSLKDKIDFYRTSLRLGAAAYLLKESTDLRMVGRHVRALALRRSLNVENPAIAAELNRIVVQSPTKEKALLGFCEGILKRELEACLAAPFFVLFTTNGQTYNCASSDFDLPPGPNEFYQTVQALAHGKGNLTEPFVLETAKLQGMRTPENEKLFERLDRAAFLPLSLTGDLKLSIGILRKTGLTSDPKALCNVLGQYLRTTVFENVINIWSQWTELHATRTSIVKWCTLLGQEIREADSEQLDTLANDLTNTGQLLHELENGGPQERQLISGPKLLKETWQQVGDNSQVKFEPSGECLLLAQKPDLEFIFSRLLQWFVWRARTMPLDVKPALKISCIAGDRDATIIFEDNSHRLPMTLREDLFAPFTQAVSIPFPQLEGTKKKTKKTGARKVKSNIDLGTYFPLYLVKMLVEGRYHGLLRDQSDAITEHPYGHRIVMQLPAG